MIAIALVGCAASSRPEPTAVESPLQEERMVDLLVAGPSAAPEDAEEAGLMGGNDQPARAKGRAAIRRKGTASGDDERLAFPVGAEGRRGAGA